jgi:hypothetical protein
MLPFSRRAWHRVRTDLIIGNGDTPCKVRHVASRISPSSSDKSSSRGTLSIPPFDIDKCVRLTSTGRSTPSGMPKKDLPGGPSCLTSRNQSMSSSVAAIALNLGETRDAFPHYPPSLYDGIPRCDNCEELRRIVISSSVEFRY